MKTYSEDEILRGMAAEENAAENERIVRDGLWPKLTGLAARLPFLDELLAAYHAARDPATPRRAKLVILATLAYFILPTDAVPDILVGFGFTDDAALFWAAWRSIRDHVTDEHRARARESLDALKSGRQ